VLLEADSGATGYRQATGWGRWSRGETGTSSCVPSLPGRKRVAVKAAVSQAYGKPELVEFHDGSRLMSSVNEGAIEVCGPYRRL